MKLPRLRWFLLLLIVALFASVYWSIFVQPKMDFRAYQSRWIDHLSAYRGNGVIPPDWSRDVGLRQFASGEWILAAMYHGVCAPGPEGCFNASVILDSSGAIHTRDWAPCAGKIADCLDFWRALEPAENLAALYAIHPEWALVQPIDRSQQGSPASK